jgi:hypothetical protein
MRHRTQRARRQQIALPISRELGIASASLAQRGGMCGASYRVEDASLPQLRRAVEQLTN